MEELILRSKTPIHVSPEEIESINVGQFNGTWLNKLETNEWIEKNSQLNLKLSDYPINQDSNPRIIKKQYNKESAITYTQDYTLHLLRPPTPPPPGDIIIREKACIRAPHAPPLIIRDERIEQCNTPEPLIIREQPPTPPPIIPLKLITISGKHLLIF